MKNIHLLPTEKPSRLILQGSELVLSKYMEVNEGFSEFNQHIYITDHNYEFKEGWYFNNSIGVKNPVFVKIEDIKSLKEIYGYKPSHLEKIILTTDKDLDGVQAIDDEFLEWFVKNPSCKWVEVEKYHGIKTSIAEISAVSGNDDYNWKGIGDYRDYRIILPKEEPKQDRTCTNNCSVVCGECQIFEPKQETPQEAAERIAYDSSEANKGFPSMEMFIKGANWQSERMYSEEEVLNILYKHTEDLLAGKRVTLDKWFEQFKK